MSRLQCKFVTLVAVCLCEAILFTSASSLRKDNHSYSNGEVHGDDSDEESNEADCESWDCFDPDFDEEWDLSDGAIAAIVIAVLIVFFIIPVGLCFCCAWCCFRGRRHRQQRTQIVAVTPVVPQQQPPGLNWTTVPPNSGNGYSHPSTNPHLESVHPVIYHGQTTSAPYPQQLYGVPAYQQQHQIYIYSGNPSSDVYEPPPPYYDPQQQSSNLSPKTS